MPTREWFSLKFKIVVNERKGEIRDALREVEKNERKNVER